MSIDTPNSRAGDGAHLTVLDILGCHVPIAGNVKLET